MTKKVLVDTERRTVHDIVESDQTFPISPPLEWHDAPIGFARGWVFNGVTLVPPPIDLDEQAREKAEEVAELRNSAIEALLDQVATRQDAPIEIVDYITRRQQR